MAETPRLDLPYLAASQAQKELYHNVSLDRLDLLCQCAVLDRNLTTPPGSPALGDAYIVAATGTGAWAGHDNHLALWVSSQWELIAPLPGFQCWVLDEGVLVYWSGTAWTIITSGGGGATTFLGLTDTPDSYSGQAGKVMQVNAGGTALEFGTAGGVGGAPSDATYIVGSANAVLSAERVLTDSADVTWNLATAGQVQALIAPNGVDFTQVQQVLSPTLVGRSTAGLGNLESISVGPGLELAGGTLSATGGGGGSSDFLGLSDTPDSYAGQGGKLVSVKSDTTGLEFLTAPASGAPVDAEYITSTAHDTLSAERVLTDTATVTWDRSTPGQIKATAVAGGETLWTRTPAPPDLSLSLQAFWRMEEASGNRVDSVSSLALVPTGTPNNAAGKTGNAVNFTGAATTYLSIADNATLSIGANQDFTIACWVYWNATPSGSQGIVGKGNASIAYSNCEFVLYISGTQLLFDIGNGSGSRNVTYTGLTLASGTWYFIVGWYDAAADIQYLQVNNGTPQTVANTLGSFDSTGPLEVGRQPQWSGSTAFNGRIDNMMLWKRVLSSTERTTLYNSGNGLDYPLPASVATLKTATAGDQVLLSSAAGTTSERLEVESGIKVGNSTGTSNGIVRWTGTDMEVRKGGAWVSMTGQGLGTLATQNANAVAITGGSATGLTTLQASAVGIATAVSPPHELTVNGTTWFTQSVGIGMPAQAHALALTYTRASQGAIYITPTADSGGFGAITFNNAAASPVGSITTTGAATAYNTSSDGRVKAAVEPLRDALATVLALEPVQFVWKADGTPGQGFIAQDALAVVPQAVTGDPDDPAPTMQMDLSKVVPHLVGALQTVAQQVQALTARLRALEA